MATIYIITYFVLTIIYIANLNNKGNKETKTI